MTTENNNIKLQEFITLGQRLCFLINSINPQTVVGKIHEFIKSLEKCELKTTLNTAKPLNQISFVKFVNSITVF